MVRHRQTTVSIKSQTRAKSARKPAIRARRIGRRLGELRHFRCYARLHRGRATLIVNHVGYFTVIAQGNCDHVMESDSGFPWNFYRSAEHDLRLDKDTVDAQSPRFVAADRVCDLVRSPSIGSRSTGVACL